MRPARKRPGVGGENRETRLLRSRAGLLQSARDFHLVFVTFGALQSLRNSAPLFALLGTAIETHVASRSLLAEYGHAFQLRYQGARKAGRNYVEIVGLQKLQIQGESLVPIGAILLDFFLTASPCSHHPHQASQDRSI